MSQTVTDRLLLISGFTCASCGALSPPQMHGRCDSFPVGGADSELGSTVTAASPLNTMLSVHARPTAISLQVSPRFAFSLSF